jgi:hypothetical protein
MISFNVQTKPKGLALLLAYAIAIPIWILSAPLIAIGNLGAWTARRRHFPDDAVS